MRKLTLVFLYLIAIGFSGTYPQATAAFAATVEGKHQSTLDRIVERNVIRIGTTGDYMPFTYSQENIAGSYMGIDIEFGKDLADSLNVDVVFIETSWPTLMTDLMADKFDIGMSGISITLERQQKAMFSSPILSDGKVAISRDEDAHKFTTIDKINQPNVKVIFNPGGTNEKFARENFPDAELILNEDNITIFNKIVTGAADVMVTDAIETIIQQEVHPELQSVNPETPFSFSEKGYLMKRDYIFKAYIDQWINLRLKDGTYNKIYDTQLNNFTHRDVEE